MERGAQHVEEQLPDRRVGLAPLEPGEREVEQETISARTAQGDRLDGLSLDAFIDQLRSNFKQLGDKD